MRGTQCGSFELSSILPPEPGVWLQVPAAAAAADFHPQKIFKISKFDIGKIPKIKFPP